MIHNKYPSVTTVLRPYINTDFFLPEHSERGQAVHAAASAHLQGLWSPPLQPDHQPYFDSFRKWADSMIDQIILVETRLYDHDLKFCGQPDLICTLKCSAWVVMVDWKTSQAEQKSWALQNAAYRHLAQHDKSISTHRGISVRLKSDGSGCLINEYPRNYAAHFNIWLGLLNAHRFFNKGGEQNGRN